MRIIRNLLVFCSIAILVANGEEQMKTRLAIGADDAQPGEFPHQVSLQACGEHICGGALISKTHVLTAAHCVDDFLKRGELQKLIAAGKIVVEVGSNVIGKGKKHKIRRVSEKRGFASIGQHEVISNDIAVITLKTPVQESDNVKIIGLPEPSENLTVGTHVTISGFGTHTIGHAQSKVLKKSDMMISSPEECNIYYLSISHKGVGPSHICAKNRPGLGTCRGDSGGPLIRDNKVVAVVSAGDMHCGAGNPDIYTSVLYYIDYVKSEMNYNFTSPVNSRLGLAKNFDDTSEQPNQAVCPSPPQDPGQFPFPDLPQIPGQFPFPDLPQIPGQFPFPDHPQIPGQFPFPGQPQIPGQLPFPGQPQIPGQFPFPGLPQIPGQLPFPGQPQIPGQFPFPGLPQIPGQFPFPGQPQIPGQFPGQPQIPGQFPFPGQPQIIYQRK